MTTDRHKHQWALTARRVDRGMVVAESFACEACPATKWNSTPELAAEWTAIQKASRATHE